MPGRSIFVSCFDSAEVRYRYSNTEKHVQNRPVPGTFLILHLDSAQTGGLSGNIDAAEVSGIIKPSVVEPEPVKKLQFRTVAVWFCSGKVDTILIKI